MLKNIIRIAVLSLLFFGLFSSCEKKGQKSKNAYDLSVLKSWGKDIILPSYKHYQSAAHHLDKQAKLFDAQPSQEGLIALQKAHIEVYKSLQHVLIFSFNHAEFTYLIPLANTYPTMVEHHSGEPKGSRSIQDNINLIKEGKADKVILEPTGSVEQYVYQGLPALDYLLFDTGHGLDYYTGVEGQYAREYISMLTGFLSKNIDEVVRVWDERMLNAYCNDDDASSNGFYAQTINAFIRGYEKQIRAEKVGLAAGAIKAQNGKPAPDVIEAYYNGQIDKELLLISLKASQDFFNGKHFGKESKAKGLYDILVEKKHEKLAKQINAQYELIYKQIESMPLSLKETAVQDNATMRKLFDLMQRNVAYYKTNMLVALNVAVNFVDTDGD